MASSLSDRFSAEEEICLRIHRIHFPMREQQMSAASLALPPSVDDVPSVDSPLLPLCGLWGGMINFLRPPCAQVHSLTWHKVQGGLLYMLHHAAPCGEQHMPPFSLTSILPPAFCRS